MVHTEGDVVVAAAHLEAAAEDAPGKLLTVALLAKLLSVLGVVRLLELEQHQLQVAETAQRRQDEQLEDSDNGVGAAGQHCLQPAELVGTVGHYSRAEVGEYRQQVDFGEE